MCNNLGELKQRAPKACAAWALLVAALVVLVYRFDAGTVSAARLLHPEALYPIAFLSDLANWSTWNLPYSPYFFPDMPLAFLALLVTPDVLSAVYVFGALQLLTLAVGCGWLFSSILADDVQPRRLAWRLAALAAAAFVLACGWNLHGGMLLQVFVAAFHTGAFVAAVFAQALLLRLLDRPSTVLAVLLFGVCFLSAFSDALFIVLFVIPALAAILFHARAFAPGRWWRAAFLVAAGGGLGYRATWWLERTGTIWMPHMTPKTPSEILGVFRKLAQHEEDLLAFVSDRFFEHLGLTFRGYWLVWVALTVLFVLASRTGRLRLGVTARRNLGFFTLLTILSFGATLVATAWIGLGRSLESGSPSIFFINRYLIGLYVLPLLAPALYVPVLAGWRRVARLEVPLLGFLILLWGVQAVDSRLGAPLLRRPPADVACLDEAALQHGLRHGLMYFHAAQRINLLSQTGLRVDQMSRDFEPVTWIASRIRLGEAAGYDFVISNGLRRRQDVLDAFGPPDVTLDCAGLNVLVYDSPRRVSVGSAVTGGRAIAGGQKDGAED